MRGQATLSNIFLACPDSHDRARWRLGEVFNVRGCQVPRFHEVSKSRSWRSTISSNVRVIRCLADRSLRCACARVHRDVLPAAVGERDNNLRGVPLGVRILQGWKREICHNCSAIEQFVPPGVNVVVIERLENPIVFALEAQLRGIPPQAEKKSTTSKPSGGDLSWSRNGRADGGSMRVNMFHAPASDTTTGARNSARAPSLPFLMFTSTPTARPPSRRMRVTSWLAAVRRPPRDYGACGFGDFTCTASRVPCSVQVMRRDHRMGRERAAAGRTP